MKTRTLYRNNELGERIPYLIRTTLFKCKLFSIKIHKVLISDTGDLHDHPWNYMSIILKGGYYEHTQQKVSGYINGNNNSYYENKKTWYKPGSILFRKGDVPHKLEIPEGKTCTSLIFTSYKWRDWGFIQDGKWIKNQFGSYNTIIKS